MVKDEILKAWELGGKVTVEVSLSNLASLAESLASFLRPRDFFLLRGDLGAGKTTLVALLARALNAQQTVASPTFSLLNVIDLVSGNVHAISRICHLDLYRVRKSQELLHLGLEIEFDASAVAIIEWCENVEGDGWKNFFEVTRCTRPSRILTLSIESLPDSSKRRYIFGWMSFSEFTTN